MDDMAHKALIVGNWKMELAHKASLEHVRAVKKLLRNVEILADVVVCPAFPQLPEVAAALKTSTKIQVGAQAVHWEEQGAFTGAVAIAQVKPFAAWCIVGHSETRELTNMSEEHVRDTAMLLLKHGITPIVCVGESLVERQAEKTVERVTEQIGTLLSGVTRAGLAKLVVAYEPIWAISGNLKDGTGEMPDPSDVAEIVLLIRKLTATRFDAEAAGRLRVIYGGSVKPENVSAYVSEPGVNGVLLGSASINAVQFVEIVKKVQGLVD